MRVMPAVPTFAVVGAVNHGKSSAVAALLQDDSVRISAMPGETVDNRRFDLRDKLVLFDTPGFQNARKALAEIEANAGGDEPLRAFRQFIETHRGDADFDAECRLLQPIVDGAGIIYVVDGSKPLRDIHLCEMEILRLTAAPRLAIVNRTDDEDHVDAWKGRLDQHFNIVRVFDAHHATHADRRDLLESLASIERGWKDSLQQAADLIEAERRRRITDAAAIVADLIAHALQHAESARVDAAMNATERDAVVARLRQRYMDAIASAERAAHRKIIALYAHHRVAPDTLPDDLFDSGLFAEETWKLFGLGVRQLMGASTIAGGIAGAGIDAATLGHSFGLGAAIGAVAGAGGAYVLGRRRPEISIAWPGPALPGFAKAALRFSGGDVVVGPFKAENFPWILLDRALCLFAFVDARSHARQDDAVARIGDLLPALDAMQLTVAHWSDADRAACQKVFKSLRSGDRAPSLRTDAMRRAIVDGFDRIGASQHRTARSMRHAGPNAA